MQVFTCCEIAVVHTTVVKLKPEKNSQAWPERNSNPWPLLIGAVLYQLSYQANWEVVALRVPNTSVDSVEYKWIYKIYGDRYEDDSSLQLHTKL